MSRYDPKVYEVDVEIATGHTLKVGTAEISATEMAMLDGITAGTVAAGKAVVVNANKDAGDFRNLDAVNIDAGSSGAAGSVDVFPGTAARGKFALACADQTGDTTVTLQADAMGQASTVHIPDPGAAASYVAQSTAALTLAEVDVLDAVTAGTVSASKAVVVDANKDVGDFRNLDAVNIDAGSSGAAGSVDVFPGTAARGKFALACADQTGDTTVTLQADAMGQASTVHIPDVTLADAYVVQTTAAVPLAKADVLSRGNPLGAHMFTVGAEGGNVINVAVQLKDAAGADLAVRGAVMAYLSDDANGDSIAGTAPDGGVAIGTDGLAIPLVANKAWLLVSESDGDIDLNITESGAATWYLIIVNPDGLLRASGAITFA